MIRDRHTQTVIHKPGIVGGVNCPIHGAGYGRCLGCLTEAHLAQQMLDVGVVDASLTLYEMRMKQYWLERLTMPQIVELAKQAELPMVAA